ncbi:hypothetical protein [Streptomyces sp. NPDC047928]|uniref:hypothetical protein n=1 Tax=unclassified Streptomyces TaxID=2593676 RepID=UPI0037102620
MTSSPSFVPGVVLASASPAAAVTPTSAPASLPASSVPETCAVPHFEPLRVRGGRYRPRWAPRRRRRLLAAGLAMTAAAVAVTGFREPVAAVPPSSDRPGEVAAAREPEGKPVETVSAPVRIADSAAVRLLRPGDRVDVIAAPGAPLGSGPGGGGGGDGPRVVATGARVAQVPRPDEVAADGGGALVVLSLPRAQAAELAGAGVTARLAVTLC